MREGGELLGAGGKVVFLQQLVQEQKMELVMVEVGRTEDRVQWLAHVCDTATSTTVTVSLGVGEEEGEAKERAAGAVLKYFHTLYSV